MHLLKFLDHRQTVFLLAVVSFCFFLHTSAIQSNSSCAPYPSDKRQLVCVCSRQLQLKCVYNTDIKQLGISFLDPTLRPISYSEISLPRLVDPNDYDDINSFFQTGRSLQKAILDKNLMYAYFPEFSLFTSPFIRITFQRFHFVPAYAFVDLTNLELAQKFRKINSIVFELDNAYDFGIEKYALYGIQSESLLIEGPFNKITIHEKAFEHSQVEELVIGCYCLECESFVGDCLVQFSPSFRTAFLKNIQNTTQPAFKHIKFYGVRMASSLNSSSVWQIDQLPNVSTLEHLEISNLATAVHEASANFITEFACKDNLVGLKELFLKNNGIKTLSAKLLDVFSGLETLNMVSNRIQSVDDSAFLACCSRLKYLNLERNRIEIIPKKAYDSLPSLISLNLKENLLEFIKDDSFTSLTHLQILDLTRNNLKSLTENTFNGLASLQTLILSYNPLKSIDPAAFYWLGTHASGLNRVDLISNYERDWFVFDDSDICLLSHFRCRTKVNIDMDQRCNCFVKFLNEIGLSQNAMNDEINDENALFNHPCVETQHANINIEESESGDYETESYVHNRDPSLYQALQMNGKSHISTHKHQKCSKLLLSECYSRRNTSHSCLHKKFLAPKQKRDQSEKRPSDNHNENNPNYHQANLRQEKLVEIEPVGKISMNEQTVAYLVIALAFVFIIASVALVMAGYLMFKRKSFMYYTAAQTS